MNSVLSHDIVLGARIREIVHLNIVFYTLSDETEAMFPYNHRVDRALADEKLALEVLRLVDKAGLSVTFRVYIRIIHVSFSIHDLIPLPVDYRAACNSNLEYIRIVRDE